MVFYIQKIMRFAVLSVWFAGNTVFAESLSLIHAGLLIDDPTKPPREEVTVVVQGGYIRAVENGFVSQWSGGQRKDNAPDVAVEIIDLRDKTVLPGLIDSHVHLALSPDNTGTGASAINSEADWTAMAAANAAVTLQQGFTTVRDMGTYGDSVHAVRDAIKRGWLAGPRIVSAGQPISVVGGHSDESGYRREVGEVMTRLMAVCTGPVECTAAVRDQVKYGADVIKFDATGGVLSMSSSAFRTMFSETEMAAIVDTAHQLGVKVAAHAHSEDGIVKVLHTGVDSVEHATFLGEKGIRAFKKSKAYLVPTLMAIKHLADGLEEGHFHPLIAKKAEAILPAVGQQLARAHRAGIPIAFGTDPGASLAHSSKIEEFEMYVQYGMTEAEALATATVNASDLLGLSSEIGTVTPGKRADLIAVAGNPLEDISILRNIVFVMWDGRAVKISQFNTGR